MRKVPGEDSVESFVSGPRKLLAEIAAGQKLCRTLNSIVINS